MLLVILIFALLYYFFIIYRFFHNYFNIDIVVKSKYIKSNTYYILSDKKYKIIFPWFKINGNKKWLYNKFKIGHSYNVNGYGNYIYSIII